MEICELEKDPAIEEWFIYVNPKESTKISYLTNIQLFCNYINKSPAELIDEADTEAENGILLKKRKIKQYITNYINHLNNLDISANTRKSRLAAVKSFYHKNEVELPAIPRNEDVVCLEENIRIPTKEELQKALKKSNVLGKAIILVGVSSGLSSNDIRNLKYSDFKNGYDPETKITTLKLRRGKTSVDFITFLSPEASKAIIEYLEFRNNRMIKRQGIKRERQLENQKVTSDDDYLFINKRVQKTYNESGNDEDRKLKRNTFMEIYRAISDECKLSSPKGKYNVIRSHNLRRYFFTTLTNRGCNGIIVKFMMGHKLSKTDSGYYRSNVELLRDTYQKYIPYLTIQKELDISENPIFIKLQNDNETLKRENEIKTIDNDLVVRLKTEYDQKIDELEKSVRRELQMQLRAMDKLKVSSTGRMKEHYAQEAQKIRDKLKK